MVTETTHTRSRRAAIGGLAVQLLAGAGALVLAFLTHSFAIKNLAWYIFGGVPLWFVALLVFRQRELAALEAMDLEELRREKSAQGGADLFGANRPGVAVAESRRQWLEQWVIPAIGVITALYLAAMGVFLWRQLAVGIASGPNQTGPLSLNSAAWPTLRNLPIAMVVLAVIMLGEFLLSRYTSGMARSPAWQLLRGCGSYMLGNAIVIMALLISLGVFIYTGVPTWERVLGYAVPAIMIVLAIETLLNFLLDIYRPRVAGVEPRSNFDSRLLGLLAEPGGIASSIADAINYQFGFQVSQTWFYQLIQKALIPLGLAGALALWLLTCLVIVQPYEHVIIERFGRQLNAQTPLSPGAHFKRPWPIDVARVYNTGQLHQINVGFEDFQGRLDEERVRRDQILLWTDEQHLGQSHFDFLVCPPLTGARAAATQPREATERTDTPVNLMRMHVAVQYRIRADRLDRYTGALEDPHQTLRDVAWEEVGRFNASSTAEELLGEDLGRIGDTLRERITARVADAGLEVVYVGVTNVHPEKTVAEAYRNVVRAEQERVAAIREALVTENERLSKVAGDVRTARLLHTALNGTRRSTEAASDAALALQGASQAAVAAATAEIEPHRAMLEAQTEAAAQVEQARLALEETEEALSLGLGRTLEERQRAATALDQAQQAAAATNARAEEALRAARQKITGLSPAQVAAVIQSQQAQVARAYWERELDRALAPGRLEGEAAGRLAAAFADRWAEETTAAGRLTEALNERATYRANPEIYKVRRLVEVLVEGLRNSRKYFLAFEPGDRRVRVRFNLQDELSLDPTRLPPEQKK